MFLFISRCTLAFKLYVLVVMACFYVLFFHDLHDLAYLIKEHDECDKQAVYHNTVYIAIELLLLACTGVFCIFCIQND